MTNGRHVTGIVSSRPCPWNYWNSCTSSFTACLQESLCRSQQRMFTSFPFVGIWIHACVFGHSVRWWEVSLLPLLFSQKFAQDFKNRKRSHHSRKCCCCCCRERHTHPCAWLIMRLLGRLDHVAVGFHFLHGSCPYPCELWMWMNHRGWPAVWKQGLFDSNCLLKTLCMDLLLLLLLLGAPSGDADAAAADGHTTIPTTTTTTASPSEWPVAIVSMASKMHQILLILHLCRSFIALLWLLYS